jgi:hypothetical protein
MSSELQMYKMGDRNMNDSGILAMEVYFPRTYVKQAELGTLARGQSISIPFCLVWSMARSLGASAAVPWSPLAVFRASDTVFRDSSFVSSRFSEKFDNASPGKYTNGLGQLNMAFFTDREDINSIALTGRPYSSRLGLSLLVACRLADFMC